MDPHSALPPEERFLARIFGNLVHPVDHFRRYRDEPFRSSFWYYLKILVIVLILELGVMIPLALMPESREDFLAGAGFAGYSLQSYLTELVFFSVLAFFCLLIAVVLDGSITHIAVFIAGGTGGFTKTVQAIMLSYVPALLLEVFTSGLILFMAIILFGIGARLLLLVLILLYLTLFTISLMWSTVVRVVALREFQEISTVRAIIAAAFTLIVILTIVGIIVGTVVVSGLAYRTDAPVGVVAGKEAPAKDWLPLAQDVMKAKDSNAVLITVGGRSDTAGVSLPLDGRCHVWTYEYASKAEDKLYIVTVRDGSVDDVRTVALSSRSVEPILYKYGDPAIRSWTVDSDQAAAVASEKYQELKGNQPPASAAYKLSLNSWHKLAWTVYNYDETTRVTANISVDPESGTVVHSWAP
ncbi:MAG: Yip1 family protein [Methanoregula sp.]|jgi:hypothetical protein